MLLSESEIATFHLAHTVKRGRRPNTDVHEKVNSLLSQGLKPKEIIDQTGIPWSTVYRIAQERKRFVDREQYGPRELNKIAGVLADQCAQE